MEIFADLPQNSYCSKRTCSATVTDILFIYLCLMTAAHCTEEYITLSSGYIDNFG